MYKKTPKIQESSRLQGVSVYTQTYPCFAWIPGIGVPLVLVNKGMSFFIFDNISFNNIKKGNQVEI